MMRSLGVLAMALVIGAFGARAIAHHSFAAEFDANKELKITGKVTKLEWMNPHAWFYLEANEVCEGPAGSEQSNSWKCARVRPDEWGFELASPNGLMRQGWTRNSMKAGDVVVVQGARAKDGSLRGNARVVAMSQNHDVRSRRQAPGDCSAPRASEDTDYSVFRPCH